MAGGFCAGERSTVFQRCKTGLGDMQEDVVDDAMSKWLAGLQTSTATNHLLKVRTGKIAALPEPQERLHPIETDFI